MNIFIYIDNEQDDFHNTITSVFLAMKDLP